MSHLHKGRLAQINDAVEDLAKERDSVETARVLAVATEETVKVKAHTRKAPRVASRVPRSIKRKRVH